MASVLILFIALNILLMMALKICKENERAIILRLDRKFRIVGPGLYLITPTIDKSIVIKIDDRCEVISPNLIKVKEIEFPFLSESKLETGSYVRIISFEGKFSKTVAKVIKDSDQLHHTKCEKCGHINKF